MITIGVPSYDHIKTECVLSLVKLASSGRLPLHFVFNQSLYIDYNRNQLVDQAISNGSTHLLFVDSDIAFPVDGVERLLAHNVDIVGGYYNTRWGNNPVRVVRDGLLVPADPLPSETFQCHVLPTGFMLIRLECLQRLQKPYFAVITGAGGTLGEDVTFCKKVTDAGLNLWCDPTIKLGHVGKKIY